jgi:hypothetical protein
MPDAHATLKQVVHIGLTVTIAFDQARHAPHVLQHAEPGPVLRGDSLLASTEHQLYLTASSANF